MEPMKTINERVREIVGSKLSDAQKEIQILQLIADDRRDSMYRYLELEKTHGPKWVEGIKKSAILGK